MERTVTKVLLVEDHPILRMGLARLLSKEPDIEVVGEAIDGRQACELARRLLPDVVVMDVSLPILDGIEATLRIRADLPQVKVIGLSMYDREDRGSAILEAGACAYLDKSGPPEELIAVIRALSARAEGG